MKRMQIAVLAVIVAVGCFAFTNAKKTKGIGTECTSTLFYFKVLSSITDKVCSEISLQSQFDYTVNIADNGNNVPDAAEVVFTISDNNPYSCPDVPTHACALGYKASQLEKDPVTLKWRPKASEIGNFFCCVRRLN